MTSFDYVALDTAGRERRGNLRAATVDEARAQLGARRLYVVRIDSRSGARRRRCCRAGLASGAACRPSS